MLDLGVSSREGHQLFGWTDFLLFSDSIRETLGGNAASAMTSICFNSLCSFLLSRRTVRPVAFLSTPKATADGCNTWFDHVCLQKHQQIWQFSGIPGQLPQFDLVQGTSLKSPETAPRTLKGRDERMAVEDCCCRVLTSESIIDCSASFLVENVAARKNILVCSEDRVMLLGVFYVLQQLFENCAKK